MTSAVAYFARCAALRHRGLSRDLMHQLQEAGDVGLLVELEAAADADLTAMTVLR